MTSSTEVRISTLNLSTRATEGIAAAAPYLRNPTVRQVIEEVTAARLLATPGVGEGTVAEVQAAFEEACGVGLIAGKTPAPAAAVAEPVEQPVAAAAPTRKRAKKSAK